MKNAIYVPVHHLCVGLFIDLELTWTEHPFLFSKFKIKQQSEISQIRKLGLKRVKVIVKKSVPAALKHLAMASKEEASEVQQTVEETESTEFWDDKKNTIDQAEKYRLERRKTAKRYKETQKRISNLVRNLRMAPANAVRDANEVIEDIKALCSDSDRVIMSMVSLAADEFTLHNHALNVTILSLMLAKNIGLSEEEMQNIGVAALLHDIGKILLPQAIVLKTGPLTDSEQALMNTHVDRGISLLSLINEIQPEAVEAIANHHVYLNGTGYPETPRNGEMSPICRILQVANHYDAMCNPTDPSLSVSPKVAMANLFSNYEGKLDSYYVQQFVRHFGVYPPGTVVKLSDDSIALVTSVDSLHLLTPTVLLYNPDIPANQALMIDLTDYPELTIVQALKPGEYSEVVYTYLGLEERLGYFFGSKR